METSQKKKLIDHLSWSVALPPIRLVYGFALAAILTKNLSVEAYGDWSLFMANLGLALTLSSMNLMYASSVRLTGKVVEQQRIDIFRIGLFRLAMTVIAFIGLAVYLQTQNILTGPLLWFLLAGLTLRAITDMTFGFLRALLLSKKQVLFFLFESTLILAGVMIGSVGLEMGLIGAVGGFVVAEVIAAGVGISVMRRYFTATGWQWGTVREYLAIGLPLIPFSFSDLIVNALLPLMIKSQTGSEAVAFYSVAQKVAMVSAVPNSIINNVIAQYLKRSFLEHGGRGVRRRVGQFFILYLGMALPLIGLLYLFGERIILVVTTDEYLGVHGLMMMLVAVNVIIMLTGMVTVIFAVYDRTRVVGFLWIAILAIFVALAWYALPKYGTIGVVWALIAAFGLGLVLIAVGGIRLTFTADVTQPSGNRSNL